MLGGRTVCAEELAAETLVSQCRRRAGLERDASWSSCSSSSYISLLAGWMARVLL